MPQRHLITHINLSRIFDNHLRNFHIWFRYALKGQKLPAQGNTLGIRAISLAPCKGKSFHSPKYRYDTSSAQHPFFLQLPCQLIPLIYFAYHIKHIENAFRTFLFRIAHFLQFINIYNISNLYISKHRCKSND